MARLGQGFAGTSGDKDPDSPYQKTVATPHGGDARSGDTTSEQAAEALRDEARLDALIERSQNLEGREHLSALSALSQSMAGYPPLPPDEQLKRLRLYRQGLAAQEKLDSGRLKGRHERAARAEVLAGRQAQTELVGSMYRLVLLICQEQATMRYGRERMLTMLPDLVSEGNTAVLTAISSFDPDRSDRAPAFSKYAGRVIRDWVRGLVHKGDQVGVPVSWSRLKRLYVARYPEVEVELGRAPTEAEMQEELRIICFRWERSRLSAADKQLSEADQNVIIEQKLRKQGMLGGIEKLGQLLTATASTSSLDSPVGDDDGATLGDMLPEETSDSPYDAVEHQELHNDLMAALSTFTERERQIVLHKYGFVDGEQWTYAKLAPMFNVSPERIRQIERSVLQKLGGTSFDRLAPHLPGHSDF